MQTNWHRIKISTWSKQLTPTVSVIIPCYNNGATIGKTLESLQEQTFRDWEAIVVNDGSTDNSGEIIHKYRAQDSRIHQIDQDNQGLPGARNRGLAIAKGEYVNFLDADDLLLSSMLQSMGKKLKNDPSLVAVHCGWIYGDEKKQALNREVTPHYEGQLFKKLAHGNLFPCHCILLRREILRNIGLFDCSLRHCHDWDLWLRVARVGGRFGCVSKALVIYHMVPGSLSRNPITFFEAGKEVIRRGHEIDRRVKEPAAEFNHGCKCSMKEAMLDWGIRCVGVAIGLKDAVQASQVFERLLEEGGFQINPRIMGIMRNDLWFAAAVPRGDWKVLWSQIGRPLLQFLLREEERLRMPGFAIESLLEIVQWHKPMSDRELISKLRKRIIHHIFRL